MAIEIVLGAVGIGVGTIASVGVIVSLVRNGKSVTLANDKALEAETKSKTEIKAEIGHIKKELDDPDYGLSAISKRQADMSEHCAGITGDFNARIRNLEKPKR